METGSKSITMQEHVDLQVNSGLSVKKYCEVYELKEHTFRYWKLKSSKAQGTGKFELVKPSPQNYLPEGVVIKIMLPTKVEISIYSILDPEYIKQLIEC